MAVKKKTAIVPRRGEVYLMNFNPTMGAEIKKIRPALILQNDISNRHSPITIVAAITSQFKEPFYPTEVIIKAPDGGLKNDSVALLNQVRSIDKKRLTKLLGTLKLETMQKIDRALQISLGLVKI